jgi:hypothetical protein
MHRVIVTTNIRNVPSDKTSGFLYVVDLDEQKILVTTSGIEVPHREKDINPRGGMRGMRGVSIHEGELAVALFSSILFFDRSWNLVRTITHPAIASIHEIDYSKAGVWVTSTANDLLARFDLEGRLCEHYYLPEQKGFKKVIGVSFRNSLSQRNIADKTNDFRIRSYFKSDVYDRLHLNSLCVLPDGQILLSLGSIVNEAFQVWIAIKSLLLGLGMWNAVLKVNRSTRHLFNLKKKQFSELIIQPAKSSSAIISQNSNGTWSVHLKFPVDQNPSHSLRCLADGSLLYLKSSTGHLIHFERSGRMISETKVTEKWLRGLLVLQDGNLLMGASNDILLFNLKEKKVISEIRLSDNDQEHVFDIKDLPDDFELPPKSLQNKIGRIISYESCEVVWGLPAY